MPEGGPYDDQRRSHRPGVAPVRRLGMVAWPRHGSQTFCSIPERFRFARQQGNRKRGLQGAQLQYQHIRVDSEALSRPWLGKGIEGGLAINDNKTTVLTAILLAQTKDELMEIGEFFGVMLRQADWKAAMVLDLKCFFFQFG